MIVDRRFLMMEAVRTSETSVDNHFTRQYITEDNSEHQRFKTTYKPYFKKLTAYPELYYSNKMFRSYNPYTTKGDLSEPRCGHP
jgi:hypothetical protein